MDDHGQPPDGWLTLTEAAARTGHTREALRQRVRRNTLLHMKGNDRVVRVHVRDLADLPPPDESTVGPGQPEGTTASVTLDVLTTFVADLRADLMQARTALDVAMADRLAAHGRAERAEERAAAVIDRVTRAEARADRAEAALIDAQIPWVERIIRAWRQ